MTIPKTVQFTMAARHVARQRMYKTAMSDDAYQALLRLAETGQLPPETLQKLLQMQNTTLAASALHGLKNGAILGMGAGGGIGAITGLGGGIAGSVGSGLYHGGIGSLIGGGLGVAKELLTHKRNQRQARDIIERAQAAAMQAEEQEQQEPAPELPKMDIPPVPMPQLSSAPIVNYTIHNFGPQMFPPTR